MGIVGGIIGLLIGLALIVYGIKGGTIVVTNNEGQSAPVSGSPNWVMIIIGVVIAVSSIGGIIAASR